MFASVLPSAATMPMASTKSGKAMIVSVTRPTMPIRPAAEEPGAGAGERCRPTNDERHRRERDGEVEPRGHDDPAQDVAPELVGAEPVRARRRLQRLRGVARERVVGHDAAGPSAASDHEERGSSAKAPTVTGFSPST